MNHEKELATGILNGHPKRFKNLIVALDDLGNDVEKFTCELVTSRVLQEEQRSDMRKKFNHNNDSSTLSIFSLVIGVSRKVLILDALSNALTVAECIMHKKCTGVRTLMKSQLISPIRTMLTTMLKVHQ